MLPAGPSALLVECDDGQQAAAVAAEAVRRRAAGLLRCTDVVPAASTVLLDGLAGAAAAAGLSAEIPRWRLPAGTATGGPLIEIEVDYDGPDLARVADLWGVSPQEVVARHTAQEHTVQFCGFAPGFAYLSGLPSEYAVPRLSRPRTAVPAGAVGLADRYTGIYPTASPGGWQLIGRSREVVLFDPDRDPPALLAPGTRVRFRAAR